MTPTPPRTVALTDKSFPPAAAGRPVTDLDLDLAEFSTPLLVLDGPALAHNIALMQGWCDARGLELMPHGKTTMSPVLWERQLRAGASGITVATGWQALVALTSGVPVVQLANTCADPQQLRALGTHLAAHPEQELVVWADSPDTIDLLEDHLPAEARVGVLTELGADGARTGARSVEQARDLAHRVAVSPVLTLRGAAGYEGALAHDLTTESLDRITRYLADLARLAELIAPDIDGSTWVSAGGSAYPDLVAEAFAPLTQHRRILRCGTYITHDDGFYSSVSPLDPRRTDPAQESLRPAMSVFARVVSAPEPGLALLDAGRRDVPFDDGLPIPRAVARTLGGPEEALAGEITALNDQHAFLHTADGPQLRVGDVVRLGISHPCTAFDRWRLIPVVDENGRVREAVETLF